ncbi:MAG: hypothetical protein IH849_02500 [Acidobacteria bacterium]|nr:hypothetical protein [Acidobacteriota bacterium]
MTKQARSTIDVRSSDGAALLITVLILLVVSLLGAKIVSLGSVDIALSGNYRSSMASFHLAESGLQSAAADLRADYYADLWDNWLVNWVDMGATPPAVLDPFPDPLGMTIGGFSLSPASPSPNPYPGTPYALGGPQSLGSGSYTRIIWLPPTIDFSGAATKVNLRVRAVGTNANQGTPAQTTIDAVVRIELVEASPYSTGMFFGSGRNGGDVIKGNNLRIAGSVLVTGEGQTKFQMQGSSKIVNNYAGIDDPVTGLGSLASKLPGLELVDFNGESVQTLETVLRIKDATLQMGGQASLGEADIAGDGYKETLDAVYTDDPPGPNATVYADVIGDYDLGNDISFPSLHDPYVGSNGAPYASFAAFLDSVAFVPALGGDLVIENDTASFLYLDPRGKGSIAWDAASEVLTIEGVIKVNGLVTLGEVGSGAGTVSAIKYKGTGVIWATDTIEIRTDVYPVGQYLQDGPDIDSLVDGNLGLVASNEIVIQSGGGANTRVIATLFAEERVTVRNPANIAGSVVTGFFDGSGTNLIQVWHVPALAQLAPFGLPTSQNLSSIDLSIVDWFHRR